MRFQSFGFPSDYPHASNREIQNWIDQQEIDGYVVVSHQVLMVRCGDNSLIKPQMSVTIWMEKPENLQILKELQCPSVTGLN